MLRRSIPEAGVTRRALMIGTAGLSFAFVERGFGIGGVIPPASAASPTTFNPWVAISPDGLISIMSPAAEMGQGSKTSLPLILAEELDADWKDVRIVAAPPNEEIYGNPGFLGMMYTAGSATVAGYYAPLRQFGAQVRRVVLDNAALKWGVAVSELRTEPSVVVHDKTGRRLSYGEIASFAVLPPTAPQINPDELKRPGQFRLIGNNVTRFELPAKIDGSARYAIDIQVPEMQYGALLTPVFPDSRARTINDAAARAVPGVVAIYDLPNGVGVGVVAETPWAAFAAKDALRVSWTQSPKAGAFDSEASMDRYAAISRGEISQQATVWDKAGDGADGLKTATETLTGEYRCDYAYHAQMEPLNAVASVSADGSSVEIWCGTQSQAMAVKAAASTLGIDRSRVKFNEVLLGGGFGRRGPQDQDFLVGALLLSREIKRPVKVLWTREDDIRNGRFRPMSAHRIEAGFDREGALTTWHHRVTTDNVSMFQDPGRYYGPFKQRDMLSLLGTELPTYAIPNRLSEHFAVDSGVRLASLRGIGFTANKFATESFVDESARKRGIDPLEFRLSLTRNVPRARAVLEAVADMSNWRERRPGSGYGLAYIDYSGTQIAGVAEIAMDRTSGEIRLKNFWVAIDPGVAVQPDNIVAQTEGSVVYGLGMALSEQITIKDGEIQQSNFYDYTVMRMRDLPDIQVRIVPSDGRPTGVGQMATPLVAPAVSNAVAELAGVRLRHTPMLPSRVLAALNGGARQ